jgi:U2 small nuclear ribonucleoprotein A'
MRLTADIIAQSEQRSNALGEREIVLRGLAIPTIENLGATRDLFDTIDLTDNSLIRLDNLPRLNRLSNLLLSGNTIESIDGRNLEKNAPNLVNLDLSHNRISGLHEIANIGLGCPKLEYLTLTGNAVTSKFYSKRKE